MRTLTPRERLVLDVLARYPNRDVTVQVIALGLAERGVRATPDSIHRTAVRLQRLGLVMMFGQHRLLRSYQILAAGTELIRESRNGSPAATG